MSSLWGKCFAAIYDPLLKGSEKQGNAERRARLLGKSRGRVLELGAGTGLNLDHYPEDIELILTEPEEPMARRLRTRLGGTQREAEVLAASAEELPIDDGSVDTVVSTLVLCTVPNQARALREARRVLKPGGSLLFLEHVAADRGTTLRRWQDRMEGPWRRFACGCHTNRETVAGLREAGFELDELTTDELETPIPLVRPLAVGVAAPA